FCCSNITVAGFTFETAWSYYGSPMTDASGDALLWLFRGPNGGNFGYDLRATPPPGSPFLTFNIQDVEVNTDLSLVIALQFADTTPPEITPTVTPTANEAGWHKGDVTVSWNVTDPESGIDSSTGCGTTTLTENTAGTVLTCSATNGAGLASERSVTIKLDRTPPTIAVTNPPDGTSYVLNQTVLANYSCQDAGGSGLASCAGPAASGAAIETSVLGGHAFTVTATDIAGNVATATRSYAVFSSLGGPVDPPPTVNTANAGAGVPVVFGLGGDFGLGIFEAGYPKSQQIDCGTLSGPIDALESTVSTPAGLRYDPGTNQYTYVWKTARSWAGSCRQLVLEFASTVPGYGGAQITALFRFR
ncbi:MAG: PxKF domain-containing protein, partial [Gaiellaceae bacterium]